MPFSPPMSFKTSEDEENSNEKESSNEKKSSNKDEGGSENEDEGESENEDEGESKDEDEGESHTPRSMKKNYRQSVGRESSVQNQTKKILRQLRHLRLSFGTFVEEAIKTSRYKFQSTRKFELIRSLYSQTQFVEMTEEANHAEYRVELRSMTKSKHFQCWKAGDVDHLEIKADNVIKEMKTRAPRLMSLFRVIAKPEDRRSNREESTDFSRWISIMAILLYTYMSRTCTRWPTMWRLQLHANGTKRRVMECLYHTRIIVGYKAVLNIFQQLSKYQKTRLRELGRDENFVLMYDNFEQTVKIKDQRMNNKSEFFSVTTAQIIEST